MTNESVPAASHVRVDTPEEWESAMAPAVKHASVREVRSTNFQAEVQMQQLPRTAFFSLRMPNTRAMVPEGRDFVAVNVITRGVATLTSPTRRADLSPGCAHTLGPSRDFEFTTSENTESLTVCFFAPLIGQYASNFFDRESDNLDQLAVDAVLESPMGDCLSRHVRFVWSELVAGGTFLRSQVATAEIEDTLWALMISAVQDGDHETRFHRSGDYPHYLSAAKEYIAANLTSPLRVADIAAAVGISVPTLNRVFRKSIGTGPQAFVKQLRLERVRSALSVADRKQTSVTETAYEFGFWHLSQFASDYRTQFGELPSETLRRN